MYTYCTYIGEEATIISSRSHSTTRSNWMPHIIQCTHECISFIITPVDVYQRMFMLRVLLYLFIHFSLLYLAPSISITSLHLSICCCCFAIPCWFTFIFPITSLCAVRRQWRRQRRQRRRRWRFGYFVLDWNRTQLNMCRIKEMCVCECVFGGNGSTQIVKYTCTHTNAHTHGVRDSERDTMGKIVFVGQ